MTVFQLDDRVVFPPPEMADETGLLAIGGDLCVERLLLAYRMGIFPWYQEGVPILWHSPDPRMILYTQDFHAPRSLERTIRQKRFVTRFDTAFSEVIKKCAATPRIGQEGTWITVDMIEAYCRLHELGFAHSAEAWCEDKLVGGLYGVSLGAAFFGESMFAEQRDASKVALAELVNLLRVHEFHFLDCQVHSDHLQRLGARQVRRKTFLAQLEETLLRQTLRGSWTDLQSRLSQPDDH